MTVIDLPVNPERLMRAAEVASILGVSKMQVYRLVKLGDLPAVIFGKSIRVRPAELTEFINSHSTAREGVNDNDQSH